MALKKTKGPDRQGREAMYYAGRQDEAYRRNAYDYLDSMAMAPRMATIAGYLEMVQAQQVLDIGCGTAFLLSFLPDYLAYTGVDISPTAIEEARERYGSRENATFAVADFRNWEVPGHGFDAIVWAGIGKVWTLDGREGETQDWLDIMAMADGGLAAGGHLIVEMVPRYWPRLQELSGDRYRYITGCDLNCFQSEESPKRAIRVLQKPDEAATLFAPRYPTHLLVRRHVAWRLATLGKGMGQAADARKGDLGYGYLYYGLARLYKPDRVVCIGSYRGFAPVSFALGLVDNGRGTCIFVDPGIVNGYWHDEDTVPSITETFGLDGHWRHVRKTSRGALEDDDVAAPIDILYIDGDHSYQGVKFDFEHYAPLVAADGLILLHDSARLGKGFTPWEVKLFLEAEVEPDPRYEIFTLPIAAGLSFVRKRPGAGS